MVVTAAVDDIIWRHAAHGRALIWWEDSNARPRCPAIAAANIERALRASGSGEGLPRMASDIPCCVEFTTALHAAAPKLAAADSPPPAHSLPPADALPGTAAGAACFKWDAVASPHLMLMMLLSRLVVDFNGKLPSIPRLLISKET